MGLPPRFEKVLKILKPLQLSAYDVSYTLPPPPPQPFLCVKVLCDFLPLKKGLAGVGTTSWLPLGWRQNPLWGFFTLLITAFKVAFKLLLMPSAP